MALELRKAQRSKAYLKLGMSAPSGGGKTLGALLIAYGLMKEKYPNKDDEFLWSRIAIIDTENGSGELYVGKDDIPGVSIKIGAYNAITLKPPFEADKYTAAIELCEENDIEVCIIDSTTHLWSGQGGLLEQQGSIAKRTGNSYTAWRDVTPQHNRFVDKLLQTSMHIIATMRSKQEYVQEKDEKTGRTTVRKLGLEPEQRKGMEYEFTTFFEIDNEHNAFGSKDRSSMFDQKTFKITPKVGQQMMQWLNGGTAEKPIVVATETHEASKETGIAALKEEIIQMCKDLGGSSNETLINTVKKYAPKGNPNSINDEDELFKLRLDLIDLKEKQETITK